MVRPSARVGKGAPGAAVRAPMRAAAVAPLLALGLAVAACGSTSSAGPTTTAGKASTDTRPRTQQPAAGYDPASSPYPDTDATSTVPAGPPAADPSVVGPPAPASASPVLAATVQAWTTMAWTIYAHTDKVDAGAGTYQFDCVGATNYFLSVGAPAANRVMRTALGIGAAYVPRPQAMAGYFAALPAGGNGSWTPARPMAAVAPGDIIAVPPRAGTTSRVTPSSWPGRRSCWPTGTTPSWSTTRRRRPTAPATPGPGTRATGPCRRTPPIPSGRPSGLGHGTIMIAPTASGAPGTLYWSVDGPEYGGQLEIAAPRT